MKTLLQWIVICTVSQAISQIRPGASWYMNDAEGLVWLDSVQAQPTPQEIQAAITACNAQVADQKTQRAQDVATVKSAVSLPQARLDALIRLLNIQ